MRRSGRAVQSMLLPLVCVMIFEITGACVLFAQKPVTGETIKKPRPLAVAYPLSLELASRHARWADRSPRMIGWAADGATFYYTTVNDDDASARPTFAFDVKTGASRRLSFADANRLPVSVHNSMGTARRDRGDYARERVTHDRRYTVFTRDGDLFVLDATDRSTRRLTRTTDAESMPRFSLDDRRVLFIKNSNAFEIDLDSGLARQLTDIRKGPKPKKKGPKEKAKTPLERRLVKQQTKLFDWVNRANRVREAREKRDEARKKLDLDRLRTLYTPKDETARIVSIAPTGRWVVLRLSKKPVASVKRTDVHAYVTETGFAETRPSRPKVGAAHTEARWAIYDVEQDALRPIAPPELAKADATSGPFVWSPDGTRVAAVALARDYRTRWIVAIDPVTATTDIADAEHDTAWIGGPGWRRFGWLADSTRLYFVSERTGWAHLAVVHYTGRFRRSLTRGEWEVQNVRLSWDGSRAFVITTERHPGERHLYEIDLTRLDAEPRRLTGAIPGVDTIAIAPDEQRFVVRHSTPTEPATLTVFRFTDDGTAAPEREIVRGATAAFKMHAWITPEVVHFPDEHGNRVYARVFRPETPHRMRPAVVRVHGAGYAQSAHRRWHDRPYDFFFVQHLLSKGYHVLDLDYRGSAGYGRDCRTEIHRHMGDTEIDSGVAAVEYLVANCGVERARIGIFGGSYGGFYTLMALLKKPGLFKAGVSLYPVTDWQHYNHWYASRILNVPDDDRAAYERSSPIYYAAALRDRLMIQHGVVDSNVHYQDTMRFAQRLIELGKTGWDVVSYPIEGHGWRHAATRLDSYRRMMKLFNEVLLAPTVL